MEECAWGDGSQKRSVWYLEGGKTSRTTKVLKAKWKGGIMESLWSVEEGRENNGHGNREVAASKELQWEKMCSLCFVSSSKVPTIMLRSRTVIYSVVVARDRFPMSPVRQNPLLFISSYMDKRNPSTSKHAR